MLFQHQKEAIDFVKMRQGNAALFHSIGLGKTLTTLECFGWYKSMDKELKLFVICPISLINGAWGEDIKKFTKYNYLDVHKFGLKNAAKFDILIANFEWVRQKKNLIDLKAFLKNTCCACAIDESSRCKSFKSLTTKAILSLRDLFKYRLIMSGTPAPNSEMEYWAQMQFLGDVFPKSFYAFRNMFFHLERNGKVLQGQVISRATARDIFSKGFKYGITEQNKKKLIDLMAPHCHFRDKEFCFDLPEQVDEIRLVEITDEQRKVYNAMKRECIAQINSRDIVAQVALSKVMKLRQIASGFAIDDNGEVQTIGESAKTKELLSVLEELGKRQVIIWCQFRHEIRELLKLLPGSVALYGETKDRDASITAFKSGAAQYLIAHPMSAGHGLTFTNCSVQIFYSIDYSWELYEQARGRTHRAGQKDTCVYIHLIADDTIDQVLLNVLRRKGAAQDIVAEWLRGA